MAGGAGKSPCIHTSTSSGQALFERGTLRLFLFADKPYVPRRSRVLIMVYVLIQGPSYRNLDFEAREKLREELRLRLESHGIRFVEYGWVWDEDDRCLLLVGTYELEEDARYWVQALESMGFEVIVRSSLPGDEAQNR